MTCYRFAMTKGDRIRLALKRRGMTGVTLAGRIGISQGTLSSLMGGKFPGTVHMEAIARELDVPLEWLTVGDNPPPWASPAPPVADSVGVGGSLLLIGETSAGPGGDVLVALPEPEALAIPDSWYAVRVRGDSAYPVLFDGQFAMLDAARSYDQQGLRESLTEAQKFGQTHDLHNNVCMLIVDHRGRETCLLKRFCEDQNAPDGFVLASINAGLTSPYVPLSAIKIIAPMVGSYWEDPRQPRRKGAAKRPIHLTSGAFSPVV
jgi:transcriptional regulator with XRE-family HTH domain